MIGEPERDLAALVVPRVGRLVSTGDRYEPFRLIDADGAVAEPVTAYFRDLLAAGRLEATVRSYAHDLLRWYRFLHAAGVAWDQASRIEGPGFLPVAAGFREAAASALGRAWPGSGRCGRRRPCALCAVGAGAFGDGAACFLRLSS
jgi:Phage integrase, N-terminal SAM-like domain